MPIHSYTSVQWGPEDGQLLVSICTIFEGNETEVNNGGLDLGS